LLADDSSEQRAANALKGAFKCFIARQLAELFCLLLREKIRFSFTSDFPFLASRTAKRFSIHGMMEEEGNALKPHQEIAALSLEAKRFLLAVERGDVASSRR